MKLAISLPVSLAALACALAVPAAAQQAPAVPSAAAPAPQPAPKLIVAISVDQYSADLFAEYRRHYTGGLARLQDGAVFPSGYQSHAATETCPGHSTILTGNRPEHTGIIANYWLDLNAKRADKTVYCSEDENLAGSTSENYTVSNVHLKVPTLGDRMKIANPASRVVGVAGKDRAAVMMTGHTADQVWWWNGKTFVTYADRSAKPVPATITRANPAIDKQIATAQAALVPPAACGPHTGAIVAGERTVGTGAFARPAGSVSGFRGSPEMDGATLAIAAGLIDEMKLGRGTAPDLIAVGLSATDVIGHSYGTEGLEMCLQMFALDRSLGDFFAQLDKTGVDYAVVLTADHGGHDLPERQRNRAMEMEVRSDGGTDAKRVGPAIAAKLGLTGQLLYGTDAFGDFWIDPKLTQKQHDAVLAEAVKLYTPMPQVAAAFTRAQILATPSPKTPPETWSLIERVRASFDPARSGDLIVLPKQRIMTIEKVGANGPVATHGSPWDNDRRVPILFWRKGEAGFEQPMSVETVDILPSLAGWLKLPVPKSEIDGRCLDLDGGPTSTCG